MAYIILPSRWTRQPTGPVEVDRSHPLASGLTGLWVFNGNNPFNVVNKSFFTNVFTEYSSASSGVALKTTNDNSRVTLSSSWKSLWGANSGTLSVLCEKTDTTYRAARIISNSRSDDSSVIIQTYTGGGTLYWNIVELNFNSVSTTTDGLQHYLITGGGSVKEAYRNGSMIQQVSESFDVSAATDSSLVIGEEDSSADIAERMNFYIAATWNKKLSSAEVVEWNSKPYSLLRPLQRRIYVPSAGTGAVNVNLSGLAATGAVGSLSKSASKALTGLAATAAVGSFAKKATVAVSGLAATGAVGTIAKSYRLTLSGQAATGAVGAFAPKTTVALSGLAASGAVGAESIRVGKTLSGVAATAAVGTLAPSVGAVASLVGLAASAAVGSLTPKAVKVLSGLAATGAVGSFTATSGTTVSLSGVAATAQVGSLSLEIDVRLSGLAATAAVGTIAPSTTGGVYIVGLTGLEASAAIGSFGVSVGVYARADANAVGKTRPAQTSAGKRAAQKSTTYRVN